jgi:regulator of nonsense transcripts 3
MHLTDESHLLSLSEAVRQSVFEDAQNTFMSPALIGPPTVEFAPYGRTPGSRRRTDARSGTIDQDPDFMAFLEALANPTTTKEPNADLPSDGTPTKVEKVTTTPLVQYLKDKKASKTKDAAAKAAKKQELQLAKGKSSKDSSNTAEDSKKKGKDAKADRSVEKAAKEAVKILTRQAAENSATSQSRAAPQGPGEPTTNPKLDISKVPGRQRGAVIAAHIRMLQRDLGFSPAQAHRQVRRDTSDAQKAERAAAAEKASTDSKATDSLQPPQSPAAPVAPKGGAAISSSKKSRGKALDTEMNKASQSTTTSTSAGPSTPMVLLKKPETPQLQLVPAVSSPSPSAQPAKSAPATASRKPATVAIPSDGATQAFIKHANPSQGVTEPLLKEAMEKFGAVSMVEIDKRKGFAYVDFADPEGLKKAMASNPISVAQGTVQVMQRRGTAAPPEKKPQAPSPQTPSRGGRGGRGGTVGRRGARGGARAGAQGNSSDATKAPASAPTGPAAK